MKATSIRIALAACGLILAGMGSVQAQGVGGARRGRLAGGQGMLQGRAGGHRGGQMGGKLGQILQQLNLSADQKQQIKSISMGARQQSKAIEQNTTLSAADKKTQVKAVHKEAHAKILAVLTPDQKTKLKELIKAAHAKNKGGAVGTAPGASGASRATTLPTAPRGASATPPNSGSTVSTVSTTTQKDDDILDLLDDPA